MHGSCITEDHKAILWEDFSSHPILANLGVDDANVYHIAVLRENVAHLILVRVQGDIANKHLVTVRVPDVATARASQGTPPVVTSLVVPLPFPAHALPFVVTTSRGSSAFTSVLSTVFTPVVTSVVPHGLVAGTTLLLHALARRESTLLLASTLTARLRGGGLCDRLGCLRLEGSKQRNVIR